MIIKFKFDGESPEIGPYCAGIERLVPDSIGRIFISRGMAEEVIASRTQKEKSREGINGGK